MPPEPARHSRRFWWAISRTGVGTGQRHDRPGHSGRGGNFDSVLVKRAAKKLRASSERWNEYARAQGMTQLVHPLLVLQAPNTPDPEAIGRALDEIFSELKEFGAEHVRHVLGDHQTLQFGAWEVPYIAPQRVEDATHVRVLIAKDGISTGGIALARRCLCRSGRRRTIPTSLSSAAWCAIRLRSPYSGRRALECS